MQAWAWLNANAGALGLLLAVLPFLWAAFTYIQIKRAEDRQRRFENYHALVKQLVQGDEANEQPYIDRQLAVVFELQKYPEYAPATRRILTGFRSIAENWQFKHSSRLVDQIDETLTKLEPRFWQRPFR